VNHITRKADGGTDDPSNLQAVNSQCHKRITTEQQGKRPARRFDARGYPIGDDPRGGREHPASQPDETVQPVSRARPRFIIPEGSNAQTKKVR